MNPDLNSNYSEGVITEGKEIENQPTPCCSKDVAPREVVEREPAYWTYPRIYTSSESSHSSSYTYDSASTCNVVEIDENGEEIFIHEDLNTTLADSESSLLSPDTSPPCKKFKGKCFSEGPTPVKNVKKKLLGKYDDE